MYIVDSIQSFYLSWAWCVHKHHLYQLRVTIYFAVNILIRGNRLSLEDVDLREDNVGTSTV